MLHGCDALGRSESGAQFLARHGGDHLMAGMLQGMDQRMAHIGVVFNQGNSQ